MNEVVYVVVERSVAGEMVVGVYSTIEAARAELPPYDSGRLNDFRVEAHVVDQPAPQIAWHITLGDDGVPDISPVIQCSTCPPLDEGNSYDFEGGALHCVIWAISPGEAIAIARSEGADMLL